MSSWSVFSCCGSFLYFGYHHRYYSQNYSFPFPCHRAHDNRRGSGPTNLYFRFQNNPTTPVSPLIDACTSTRPYLSNGGRNRRYVSMHGNRTWTRIAWRSHGSPF